MNEILQKISELKPYSKKYIFAHEEELRQEIVRIAEKWLGANYHINGMIPYKYCDCHTLLIMTYAEARIIKLFQPQFYRQDFSFHTLKETYLEGMKKFAKETTEKKPGDVILYRYARLIDHAAIVIDEAGTMIDSCITRGVTLQDYNQEINKSREVCSFSFWEK